MENREPAPKTFKMFDEVNSKIKTILDKTLDTNLLCKDIEYIKVEMRDIKDMLKDNFVTKDQFEPIKMIVYGLVGVILLSFIGAVVSLVIMK